MQALLVTVYEGRNFSKKANAKCYIQCRCNNEILTTDPTDHTPSPIWDTELQWDMDMRTLSHHRSHRNSLKLVCYSIDLNGIRENLGFVMLGLRAAHLGFPAPELWYPLVNTKTPTGSFRPEIKVSFGVGPKEIIVASLAGLAAPADMASPQKIRPVTARPPRVQPSNTKKQPPVMQKSKSADGYVGQLGFKRMEDGYYQIGQGTNPWTLSLTIAFVENLNVLLDQPPLSDAKFHFYYSILGNDIATEPFTDLSTPSFPYERVTVHLRCSLPDLVLLLDEMDVIVINLCSGNQILGFADIPLADLLDEETGQGQLIERVYSLYNPKLELPMNAEGKVPSIGLAVKLEADDSGIAAEAPNDPTMSQAGPNSQPSNGTHDDQQDTYIPRTPSPPVPSVRHKIHESAGRASPAKPANNASFFRTAAASTIHYPPPFISPPQFHPAMQLSIASDVWNQYRFSIELRSMRDFTLKSGTIFCRYSYPPFGTSSPFSTHPPLDVLKSPAESLLPHSFCAFEFVMAPDRLQTYLEAVPLVVEMWSRDSYARDAKIGTASVDMVEVWQAHARRHEGEVAGVVSVKSHDAWVVVVGSDEEGQVKRICDLRVILALEDFGPLEQQESQANGPCGIGSNGIPAPAPRARGSSKANNAGIVNPMLDTAADTSIHDTPEYRAALDLEVWRMDEERRFKDHLLAREQDLMKQLAGEWRKHEQERDILLHRRGEDLKQLEAQAQRMITDLESRERRLLVAEEDLAKRRDEMEREHERYMSEVRDTSRRLADELKHRLEVEKDRAAHSEAGRERAIKERDEFERRYKELEASEHALRAALATGPDAQLKGELASAVASGTNLQRQVDTLTRAKKHYKANWMRALNELAKERSRRQLELENQAQKAAREADDERARERDALLLERDRREIDAVRKEVETLRASMGPVHYHGNNHNTGGNDTFVINKRDYEALDSRRLEEVDRLASERDQLLASGVYTREDRLVRELERRIREVLSGKA
ncbi:hypothetical protein SeMB42_g00013 [Synchytrium endobioticum]|nr:hypothetical protein SeMB42_g00013 [Synchytrium endobioticum]